MRAKTYTVTASAGGTTYSPAWPVDTYGNPVNLGLAVVVTGSALYDVQHTFTDPGTVNLNANPAANNWFNHEFMTSAATNDDGNYAFPIRATRLALRAAASATAQFTIIQAGPE